VGAQHVSAAFLKHHPARTIGPNSLAAPRRPTLQRFWRGLRFAGATLCANFGFTAFSEGQSTLG
jgi:hypothetical protein